MSRLHALDTHGQRGIRGYFVHRVPALGNVRAGRDRRRLRLFRRLPRAIYTEPMVRARRVDGQNREHVNFHFVCE